MSERHAVCDPMHKADFCVVVPAYNEEKVIDSSLMALKQVVEKKHIYVVSDGSTDRTAQLAKNHSVSVLNLRKNRGKAGALDCLIKKYCLTDRYKYILFSDADSRLSSDFYNVIKNEVPAQPACIVGTVTSDRKGFISAFRIYEYSFSHRIFKNAQNIFGAILVAPGCASLYRSDVLEALDFSNHTLTEDLDLTVQIHKKKLGKIVYSPNARVITQDPMTLRDYWRQVLRWYTGFWQNVVLHKIYKMDTRLSFEFYMFALDCAMMGVSVVFVIMYPTFVLRTLFLSYLFMLTVSMLMISLEKQYWALVYAPFFPCLFIVNIIAYISAFFRALLNRRQLGWQKVERYETTA